MDREDQMFMKSMLPGMIWIVAGFLATWMLPSATSNAYSGAIVRVLLLGPALMVGWGMMQMTASGWRYYQWQRGSGYDCVCGGLLGPLWLKRGYRRCLACGRRHYE